MAQEGESEATATTRNMRPIVRGQHFAVASMKAEATRAAERILEKGGNAFDAIVAGQAVLGVVDAAMNGVGSDAVLLVYDSRAKRVYSINAEAIDLAENGFPVGDSLARAIAASPKLRKYLAPGKWPRSTLQGTLVMKDGQPHMVLGTPGADQQVLLTMQTLLNMIEFGMNVQQSIEAPKWLTRAFPASPFPHTMYPGDLSVESRIPEAVREQLLARGHKLRVTGPWSDGSLAAIVIDPKTGVLNAGTDPRTEASAWAW